MFVGGARGLGRGEAGGRGGGVMEIVEVTGILDVSITKSPMLKVLL